LEKNGKEIRHGYFCEKTIIFLRGGQNISCFIALDANVAGIPEVFNGFME
jgi:hypothetical protein